MLGTKVIESALAAVPGKVDHKSHTPGPVGGSRLGVTRRILPNAEGLGTRRWGQGRGLV